MRLKGIPPDISYGLQCSVECFDITHDVMTFFYQFNEKVDLADRVDNYKGRFCRPDVSIGHSLRRSALDNYYAPYNEWFWTNALPDERAWCLAAAAETSGRQSAEVIDSLSHNYVSDALANDLDPTKRRYQEEWLNRNEHLLHAVRIMGQVGRKIDHTEIDEIVDAFVNPANFALRLRKPEQYEITRDGDPGEQWCDELPMNIRRVNTIEQRRRRKQERKAASRSAAFLNRIMGKQQTTMFLGGDRIEVEGSRFVFSVKKKNLFSTSHGALSIVVHEKKTRERLFDLCWYVDKTPAIDQIAAMSLAVQAGDEDEIIRVGNAFSTDRGAVLRHADLHDVIKVTHPDPTLDDLLIDGPVIFDNPRFRSPLNDEEWDALDDRTTRSTPGTYSTLRNTPHLYTDFSKRVAKRIMRGFDNPLRPIFMPHDPSRIRPIVDGRAKRDLIRDEPREENLRLLGF